MTKAANDYDDFICTAIQDKNNLLRMGLFVSYVYIRYSFQNET